MGRSGGGGGGGRSGGGFGGGRSSGGFSGGGRSSGSSSYRSSSSSSRSSTTYRSYSSRPSTRNVFVGGNTFGGSGGSYHNSNNNNGGQKNNITTTILTVVVVIVFLLVLFSCVALVSGDEMTNTTERTALSGAVKKTDWYRDDIGWVSSKSVLIEGMEYFYNETGVQPYFLLVSYDKELWKDDVLLAEKADEYLEKVYEDTFDDEAHFIFAYFEAKNDSRNEMDGEFRYMQGYSVDTIMDNEALKIFWGYFEDNYYDTSLTMEEMVSETFTDTADSIMSKPTNIWDFAIGLAIIGGIVMVVVGIVTVVKTKARRAKEKEEYTKKILETPLEAFGDEKLSELEEKYK